MKFFASAIESKYASLLLFVRGLGDSFSLRKSPLIGEGFDNDRRALPTVSSWLFSMSALLGFFGVRVCLRNDAGR